MVALQSTIYVVFAMLSGFLISMYRTLRCTFLIRLLVFTREQPLHLDLMYPTRYNTNYDRNTAN